MKRRRFIALLGGAGLIWPLVARAQETGKYYRIAIVHPVRRVADMSEEGDRIYRAFFSELRRLGYVEGKNLIVERRSAEGHTGHYPDLTQDVVQLRPNVICVQGGDNDDPDHRSDRRPDRVRSRGELGAAGRQHHRLQCCRR